jgi:hypothetical protein
MMQVRQKVLICGIREIKRKEKSDLIFLDWYVEGDGAKNSFLFADDVKNWSQYIGKNVECLIQVSEYKGQVQYRVNVA